MSREMRKIARVSYYEPEEPSFDEYVYCTSCGDYVYEYCSIHGPLLVIPDDKVPFPTGYPSFVPRAALTIPHIFLHLAPSTIPDAGIGVFSTLTLPRGVRFGPYRGLKTDKANSTYCWQIFDKEHKPSNVLDARDPNKSNWMRYVNCSRHSSEQNLVAFQYQGQLFYRTIRIVPRFTELLVFYGSEFASELNVDLRRYHSPVYTETLVKCAEEKSLEDTMQPTDPSTIIINDLQSLNTEEFTPKSNNESQYRSSESTLIIDLDDSEEENETGEYKSREHEISERSSVADFDLVKENVDPDDIAQDTYKCDNCNQKFNENSLYVAHLATHIVNNNNTVLKNVCLNCNIRFFSKSDHINHNIKMHNSNIVHYACTICDYKTVRSYHLKVHMEIHGDVKIKCGLCEFETVSNYYLKRHEREQHTTQKKNHTSQKKSHTAQQKNHTAQKTCTCTICGKNYQTNSGLNRHMRSHMEGNPYKCTICNKHLCERNRLMEHMKTHTILTQHSKNNSC